MTSAVWIGGIGLALYALSRAILVFTQNGQEPPTLDASIPFISPIVNMARKGINYFILQADLPIYTIRMPWTRIYIVNSTSLIPVVQRQVHSISFAPILVRVAANLMGASKTSIEIISRDTTGPDGFLMGVHRANHVSLTPGSNLDALNIGAMRTIGSMMDKESSSEAPVRTSMNQWVYRVIMMAITDAVYGPGNPFRDPEVVETWHRFKPGLLPLMINVLPGVTAAKYLEARESLVKVFEKYFDDKCHLHPEASAFIRERYELFCQQGIPANDRARIEVVTSLALLINTVPTATWFIYHAFSDPAILSDCRAELAKATKEDNGVSTVDLEIIKHQCPIMLSTFQEVLRFHTSGVATRQVLQDHLLDGRYLLKKGSMLLIPASVQHNLTSTWGDDAGSFNHKRFVALGARRDRKRAMAFRAFGGGLDLCPGRHFATTDVLAFAALAMLRFDIQPTKGEWVLPTTENTSQGFTINQPDTDVEIEIRSRSTKAWKVVLTGSNAAMPLSAEDMGTDEKDAQL
ncbi:cytochrome P450 [Stachybotrys elegans]|uniref:Cytochrome P450 n=1 Tax=Stachybotrys elegans TaxID=80388 RepID=A0A8K0S9H4_9HYPO|nr:cytochrome P450 [Stachybotrys elegans]